MENHDCCFKDILKVIDVLQRNTDICEELDEGCTRPFLGSFTLGDIYNTRPVTFFTKTGGLYSLPYTFNGTTGESSVFRVDKVKDCCVTVQILIPKPDTTIPTSPYIATDSFLTINLNCVGVLRCLTDVVVQNI